MAEALKRKLKTRRGHQLVTTNLLTKTRGLLPPLGNVADGELKLKLEGCKRSLEKKKTEIQTLNDEILEAIEDEKEIEDEIVGRAQLDEEIEEVLCRIDAVFQTRNEAAAPRNEQQTRKDVQIKLPKLPLLTFNGNPTEWTSFWDGFQASIDGHPGLAKVEKLKYLQGSLTSIATETITGLQITNDNYDEAVKLLEQRFGNKQIIISQHIEGIMELAKITTMNDLRKLHSLYDRTEATVRSLKNVGVPIERYGTILSPVIMSKLPNDLRLIISRKLPQEWELEGLLKHFGEELNLREKCAFAAIQGNTAVKSPSSNEGKFKRTSFEGITSSTATLFAGSNEKDYIPNCLFCNKRHFSVGCTTVRDPFERKKILRQRRRCFVCLKSGHESRQCVSQTKCHNCHNRHHTAICGANSLRNGQSQQPQLQPQQPPQPVTSQGILPQNAQPAQYQGNVSTNLYTYTDAKSNVTLLQTAQAYVHKNENPNNLQKVRVILDSCSQKSYVTTKLRDRLKLQTIKTDEILIKEFGNESGTLKRCDCVQLAVRCADNLTAYINAYVVDLICSPISHQAINLAQSMYPHLHGLILADSSDGTIDLEADVMIGADFVHSFMLDKVVRGEHVYGPVAILMRFGYVLSGPIQLPAQNAITSNVTVSHVLKVQTAVIQNDDELKSEIKNFWDYETLGIKSGADNLTQNADLLDNKIHFDGKRYETFLPFKEEHPVIPDNYHMSKIRLESQLKRLKLKPDLFNQYEAPLPLTQIFVNTEKNLSFG